MSKVYVIYTDYTEPDGIALEGVASNIQRAMEIARGSDLHCCHEVVIESYEVNALKQQCECEIMVIKNGKVVRHTCPVK